MDPPIRGALQEPNIAVAGNVNQPFDGTWTALVVDQYWRRDFVPIPGVIGVVLKITFYRPSGHVQRQRRRGVEIVTRPLVAHPGSGVTDPPIRQVRPRIIVASNPHRTASGLPLIALGPAAAARFARSRNRISTP